MMTKLAEIYGFNQILCIYILPAASSFLITFSACYILMIFIHSLLRVIILCFETKFFHIS